MTEQELEVLADLQQQTDTDADLLQMVEIGNDAGIEAYYAEVSTVKRPRPMSIVNRAQATSRLGTEVGFVIFGKIEHHASYTLPAEPTSNDQAKAVRAAKLAILLADFATIGVDFGHEEVRALLTSLQGDGQYDLTPEELAAVLLLGEGEQTIGEERFGYRVTRPLINRALSHVRILPTAALIPEWQDWSPETHGE